MSMFPTEPQEAEFDLTVATVCYNAAAVLPHCMAAMQPLLHGGALRTEYLVIDGASTDGTVALLEEAQAQGRLTRFVSEKDAGIYDAMNKALRLARGRVIVFINADDEIVPEGVPACCAPILEGRCEYCVGRVQMVDAEGNAGGFTREDMGNALMTSPYCHQGMYASVALLRRMGGFAMSPDLRIVADVDLMGRLAAAEVPMLFSGVLCAKFSLAGVSGTDCRTQRELLLLMCRNREYIARRLERTPGEIHRVAGHLLRYAGMLEQSTGEPLAEELREAARAFLECIGRALPAATAQQCRRRWRRQALRYRLLACFGGRKAVRRRSQAGFCRFMAAHLGSADA